jgi:succinate-semialdehyde dehydrogenase/glutarate-semialdehyde dehydrogenase
METTIKRNTIKSINPATEEVLKEYEVITPAELDNVISKADLAFKIWKNTSFTERAKILNKAADLMMEKQQFLAELITVEMGKKIAESLDEVAYSSNFYRYYATNAEKFLADKQVDNPTGDAFITYDPIGVLLSIQPWNFPYYQVLRVAAPQLMAGNVMILKHASNVPQCGQAIADILLEAGMPEGVFTNVFLPGSQVPALMDDPRIKGVMLTGSKRAGASIASAASKNVKKATLELGGSDPLIVLDDANIDEAVSAAVYGRMFNAGQACISPKRIIVMENIADEFLRKSLDLFDTFAVSDPMDPTATISSLSSESAVIEVLGQVNKAVEQGAQLLRGGNRINRKGAYMEPAFLTGITREMDAFSEEIFGPVFMFYRVKNEEEAIELANATEFGLGGSVFGNPDHAVAVARKIDSGMVFINQTTFSTPEIPFGGTKNSGFGRELSEVGIHEFLNARVISIPKK